MTNVDLDPADLARLFGGQGDELFLLVASPTIRATIRLANRAGARIEEFTWYGPDSRGELLSVFDGIRRAGFSARALMIIEDEFEHFLPEQLASVKVGAISFHSAPFRPDRLRRYLSIIEGSDYRAELALESAMVGRLSKAARVLLRSPALGTEARFEHRRSRYWFSLNGPLDAGQQTVLPTGELSTLTDPAGTFTLRSPFAIDGSLALQGLPIIHRGTAAVSPEETHRAFRAMSALAAEPVIAQVEGGMVVSTRPVHASAAAACRALDELFESDERYRKIHEVGLGTNPRCARLANANFFPNERWPGLHLGFGLGGYTPFHVDLTCTQIDVLTEGVDGTVCDLYTSLGLGRPSARGPAAIEHRAAAVR